MAILRQQAAFVDELYASGIVNDQERQAMQARQQRGSGCSAPAEGHLAAAGHAFMPAAAPAGAASHPRWARAWRSANVTG